MTFKETKKSLPEDLKKISAMVGNVYKKQNFPLLKTNLFAFALKIQPEDMPTVFFVGVFGVTKEWNILLDRYVLFLLNTVFPLFKEYEYLFEFEKIIYAFKEQMDMFIMKKENSTLYEYYREVHFEIFGNRDYT